MRIRGTHIADGPGPSEVIVGILTVEGTREEVVLSKRLFQEGRVHVGSALLQEKDRYLIELPREAASGRWRIWIPASEVIEERSLQPAE